MDPNRTTDSAGGRDGEPPAKQKRPQVLIAIDPERRAEMLADSDLERLESFAQVEIGSFPGAYTIDGQPPRDPAAQARLAKLARDAEALIVAPGSPCVTATVLEDAPALLFVGELEGDRFFGRLDVEAAAARGVTVVDTTHGSSWPVAEWTLALSVLGLRDAPRFVRDLHDHRIVPSGGEDPERLSNRELGGRRVGLIGFGHIAWRLVELLRPFAVELIAHDPFVPREAAEITNVAFGSLDVVMGTSDVVICLVPLTPGTRGMVRERHLRLMQAGSTFVNVSRGAVVDPAALEAVAGEGRVVFCLDVFEPEPIPAESPLRDLPNVLLTPHLAGTTSESRTRFFSLMVDELARYFEGLEPRAQLTPRVAAGRSLEALNHPNRKETP